MGVQCWSHVWSQGVNKGMEMCVELLESGCCGLGNTLSSMKPFPSLLS